MGAARRWPTRGVARQWGLAAAGFLVLVVGLPLVGCVTGADDLSPPVEEAGQAVTVTLQTRPAGARVKVDGQDRGKTPIRLQGRESQLFEIDLQAPGRVSEHRYLVLKGETPTLTWALDAKPVPVQAVVAVVPPRPTVQPTPRSTVTLAPPPPPRRVVVLPPGAPPSPSSGYAALDERVNRVPDAATHSIERLAATLVAGVPDQQDQARVIFVWIARHIRYDVAKFYAQDMTVETAEETLAKRMGMCGGYAALYDALARQAGLECRVVTGNGKGVDALNPAFTARTNHAWISVKLNGQWRLIDPTWGSGALGDNRSYVQEQDDFYFLTPPEQFGYTHFPDQEEDQLVAHPLTWDDYQALPHVDSHFFTLGLTLPPGTNKVLSADAIVTLLIGARPDVQVMAKVDDGNTEHNDWAFSQRDGDHCEVRAGFPRPGNYRLVIFGRRDSDPGRMFRSVVDFPVHAAAGRAAVFPTTYSDFATDKAYLFEPMAAQLSASQPQSFKVRVPGAAAVNIVNNQHWTQLKREGDDEFGGSVSLEPGDVYVVPSFAGEQKHHSILKYTAR